MASIFDEASNYESPTTKNVADLELVSTKAEIEERGGKRKDGTEFKYKVIVVNNIDYRVPVSVLKSLKAMREEMPNLTFFKVKKSGEGLETEYTIIPIVSDEKKK